MLIHSGCIERMEEIEVLPTEHVSFKATLDGAVTKTTARGSVGTIDFAEEEWVLDMKTKTSGTEDGLHYTLNGLNAGVYAYFYSEPFNENNTLFSYINGHKYTFDVDQLQPNNNDDLVKWSTVEINENYDNFMVLAYVPMEAVSEIHYQTPANGELPASGAPVIKIPNAFAKKDGADEYIYQKDILVADAQLTIDRKNKSHRKEIPLEFEHIYSAIKLKAGFACTIKSVEFKGIYTGGDYVLGSGWDLDGHENVEYSIPVGDGLDVKIGDSIGGLMLMIPQTFASGSKIVVTYLDPETNEKKIIQADLEGVQWRPGTKITYTLKNFKKYVYLDLAAGDIMVFPEDGKTKYTGKVYKNQVLTDMSGDLDWENGQELYVYQSCVTKTNNKNNNDTGVNNYKIGYQGDNTVFLPSYPPVKKDGVLWPDYITNDTTKFERKNDNGSTSIELQVLHDWDNALGAGKATSSNANAKSPNQSGAEGAVRKAGREATKYRIHIDGNGGINGKKGSVGNIKLNIDNLYSSYQERGSTPVRKRTTGGISFIPDQRGSTDSQLTIHIIGDNRFGCINYQNWNKNKMNSLVFEGSGSLTVGDTDYYRDGSGLGSNRSCSVIGGKDEEETEEDVWNMIFNGGVIYAGAVTSTCTAIGGGGNGDTNITINGGTITAVAKTTGTAIGGGTGLVQPGGVGNVTINNGNVYAYNYRNSSNVPAAAIGAAGSQSAVGGSCTVNINGGYVYAYSEFGTAIGGGSSSDRPGGKGTINISGGTVIAKTGDKSRNSTGIGGGSSYTSKYGRKDNETKNGGDAVVKITGGVVRTGSIGGGTPGFGANDGGTIGAANVTVEGGDIQAQFVMAKSKSSTKTQFIMNGGVIRNSATSDDEYHCIQPNGGAVYMAAGEFSMIDGEIRNCHADKSLESKGGAVYIEGDKDTQFIMSGGKIRECMANSDGGAVYLKTGTVEISGGTIQGNVAYNGNGGAISILGGDFTMKGSEAWITENAALGSDGKGNGGGIYVAPASKDSKDQVIVNLTKGKITANSSDGYGGGICVDMGKNTSATLKVTVGPEKRVSTKSDDEEITATNDPLISENSATLSGGGMYVYGANASVLLYDGNILYNGTSSYQVNPNMTVEGGGLVTLNLSGITTQAEITFSDNAYYYSQGVTPDSKKTQYVVASAKTNLDSCEFTAPNEFYPKFEGWSTKKDAKIADYKDGTPHSFDKDITLFAVWSKNQ